VIDPREPPQTCEGGGRQSSGEEGNKVGVPEVMRGKFTLWQRVLKATDEKRFGEPPCKPVKGNKNPIPFSSRIELKQTSKRGRA